MILKKAKTTKKNKKETKRKGAKIRKSSNRSTSSGGGGKKTSRGRTKRGFRGNFELYVRYTHLENSILLRIVDEIENIKEYAFISYQQYSSNILSEKPSLNIIYLSTGQSITFKYSGSLVPKIELKDGDYIISIHKSIMFSAFVAYFFFQLYNSYLEVRVKQLDIEIKKVELREKSEDESEQSKNKKEKELKFNEFMKYLRENPDILEFRLNDKKIK